MPVVRTLRSQRAQLVGARPLTVSISSATDLGAVGSPAALLLVARAHYLTRIGFTAPPPSPETDSLVR